MFSTLCLAEPKIVTIWDTIHNYLNVFIHYKLTVKG